MTTPLTRAELEKWLVDPKWDAAPWFYADMKVAVLAIIDALETARVFGDQECAARMEAQAEVARLRAERDSLARNLATTVEHLQAVTRGRDAAYADNERLREALRRVDAEADHAKDCLVWGGPGTATQDDGCSCYVEAVNAALAKESPVDAKADGETTCICGDVGRDRACPRHGDGVPMPRRACRRCDGTGSIGVTFASGRAAPEPCPDCTTTKPACATCGGSKTVDYCACGCGLTTDDAVREAMKGPAALNRDQAEANIKTERRPCPDCGGRRAT